MKKRLAAFLLLLLLPAHAVLAETYAGKTVAARTEIIQAGSSGILASLSLVAGQRLIKDEAVGSIRPKTVFAQQSGTVARLTATAGDSISGTVVELSPESRFTFFCTAEGAYERADNQMVHIGETVYIRCINDGSHRGVGVIAQIDGNTYQIIATGGDFYNGETVRIYRKPGYPYLSLIGEGTVVASETEPYDAEGTLIDLWVQEGEQVERGQRLFSYADECQLQLCSPCDGILMEIMANAGDRLEKGQTVAIIAPSDSLRIEIEVEEADMSQIAQGKSVSIIRADDPEETPLSGVIEEIGWVQEDGCYMVRILPESLNLPLGLSVEVEID